MAWPSFVRSPAGWSRTIPTQPRRYWKDWRNASLSTGSTFRARCIVVWPPATSSTIRIPVLAGLSELHGFVVADFTTGEEIHRVKFPDLGGPVKMLLVRAAAGNPNHGIGVQPDNKAVWVTDRLYNVVHAYSLPELKYLGAVPVAVDPFWMTFTPDSKFVYVANDSSASVSAIDTQSMKEVARIPVGQVPKRNITAMLP